MNPLYTTDTPIKKKKNEKGVNYSDKREKPYSSTQSIP